VQQGGQRKLWVLWLIIGLLLLINAGVVGYFLSQDKQKEQVSVVRPVSEIPQQGKAEERKTPVRSGEATLPRLPDAPVTPEIRRDPPTPVVKQPPPKPKVQPKLAPKPKAKEFHEQLEQLIPKISEGDMLSSHKPMPRVTTSSALPKPRRELSPIAKCRTLLRNKRYQSAKKCLDALVKQLGQKAPSQVHFLLGETTAHLGQCFDVIEKQKHILCFEAREHYRRYLKLAPNTPSAAKVRKMLNTTTTTVQPKPPPKPKAKPKPPQKNRYSIQERQARARHVMVRIPGGPFLMGSPDGEGWEHEKPQLRINLPMYYIDKYEVSVEQYRRCVVAGSCKRAHFTTSGENSNCNYGVSGKERHPMNCVNWYGARAYCAWAGKRLCNEAEWEKAARGTDGRKYPWGNSSPNCSRARYHDCGRGMVPVDALSAGASPIGVRLRPK
jgi:formylglycine-generating enzyme required for sulfatase activity